MSSTSAGAHTVIVKADGSGDVPTIQAGVDWIESLTYASDETLLVMPGRYEEDVGFGGFSNWSANTLLCPGGSENTLVRGLGFASDSDWGQWEIDGLGISTTVDMPNEAPNPFVWRHCHFRNGVYEHGGSFSPLEFHDCRFGGDSWMAQTIYLDRCEFYGGTLELTHTETTYQIYDCWFHDSPHEAVRLWCDGDTDLLMERCRFERDATGMMAAGGGWAYAWIEQTVFRDIRGAAIRDTNEHGPCPYYSSPTMHLELHRSRIENCWSAIQWREPASLVELESDTLRNLRQTAIDAMARYLVLQDLIVDRVSGDGAVVAGPPCSSHQIIVSGCQFRQTRGAGLRCSVAPLEPGPRPWWWREELTITNNTFLDNAAGGVVVSGGDPQITRNVIAASGGAGLVAQLMPWPSGAVIDSNTVVGNRGPGMVMGRAFGNPGNLVPPSLSRNIVAFNDGIGIVVNGVIPVAQLDDVYRNAGGSVSGITPDPSWIEADPLLCDPTNGDFQLGALSLCATAQSGAIGALGAGCDAPNLLARVWGPGGSRLWREHYHDRLPLAIFGSRYLDVIDIDPSTVRLAGASSLARGPHAEKPWIRDLDGDGESDLVLWFDFDDLHLGSATIADVEARTRDGDRYVGHVPLGRVSRDPIAGVGVGVGAMAFNAPVFALMGAAPNPCTASQLAIRFSLPSAEPSTLELIDVAGRIVARREVGAFGVGEHRVGFAAADVPASGVYWARLRQGDRRATSRVVIVR